MSDAHGPHLDRRTIVRTAAWGVPVVSLAAASPAFAASSDASLKLDGTHNPPLLGALATAGTYIRGNTIGTAATANNLRTPWELPAYYERTGTSVANYRYRISFQAYSLTLRNPKPTAGTTPAAGNAATDLVVTVYIPAVGITLNAGSIFVRTHDVPGSTNVWVASAATAVSLAGVGAGWMVSFTTTATLAFGSSLGLNFSLAAEFGGLNVALPLLPGGAYAVATGKDAVRNAAITGDQDLISLVDIGSL